MWPKELYRPDTCLAIAFLTMRVRAPNTDDWEKLCHLIKYLRGYHDWPLVLGADNNRLLMWYVDTSFAVHPNMRKHTGGGLTMGRGFPISVLTKQKLNTRSSTESELVGVNDMIPIIRAPHGARAYPWILSKYFPSVRASVRPSVRVSVRASVRPPTDKRRVCIFV